MTRSARRWRLAPDSAPHPLVILGKDNAYQQVQIYADRGEGVTVERWKGGEWALFERIEPASPDPLAAALAGRRARMEESERYPSSCIAHRRRVTWIPAPGWWIHADNRSCSAMWNARAPEGVDRD